jgi:carboxyl-terminal processing protease
MPRWGESTMKKLQVWLPLLFAVVMIIGMRVGFRLREKMPQGQGFFDRPNRTALQEVIDLVEKNYVDPIKTDTLADDAVEAMLQHLDPHSIYIPASHLQEVNEDLQGNFEGIGVEFQIIRDTVHVVTVLPGGPSDKAGVKFGDKFLSVSDSAVAGVGITSEKIKNLLRGAGGTAVSVKMLRQNKPLSVQITRGTIPLYSVDAAYMVDDSSGYIHLNKFSGTSYEEFMRALEDLQKKGMKRLIFDLRDNGGGILGEAVDITDEFLDGDKLIVYTLGDKQEKVEYRSRRPGLFETGKLVILVDEGSASASEVIAGALQDWDRATIVGRRTFGKGLVQQQYPLTGGSALRLTVARYYTPTGRSIQKSYSNGRGEYNDEVLQRFHTGEVMHPDTVKNALGPAFRTNGGRTVYGGGGITPDLFIPFDTAGFKTDVSPLFVNQHFAKFIYLYYTANKGYFDRFSGPSEFASSFEPDERTWAALNSYISENEIELLPLPPSDKREMDKRIKMWMARQIWRMPGYFQVANGYDRTVVEGLKALNGKELVTKR